MSQFKILQAIEEAIFEIMAWIMLLPKTFLQVIFKPRELIAYVDSEWEKKPDDRFDEFLSPIVFWIIVAVLPLTYTLLSSEEIRQNGVLAIFLEAKILPGAIIASLLLFIYLMWIELTNHRPLKKSTLQQMFYVQCYFTSPAVLMITLVLQLTTTLRAIQGYLVLSILFLIFYEMFVMKVELEVRWLIALWNAVLPLIISALIIGFVILIVMMI